MPTPVTNSPVRYGPVTPIKGSPPPAATFTTPLSPDSSVAEVFRKMVSVRHNPDGVPRSCHTPPRALSLSGVFPDSLLATDCATQTTPVNPSTGSLDYGTQTTPVKQQTPATLARPVTQKADDILKVLFRVLKDERGTDLSAIEVPPIIREEMENLYNEHPVVSGHLDHDANEIAPFILSVLEVAADPALPRHTKESVAPFARKIAALERVVRKSAEQVRPKFPQLE